MNTKNQAASGPVRRHSGKVANGTLAVIVIGVIAASLAGVTGPAARPDAAPASPAMPVQGQVSSFTPASVAPGAAANEAPVYEYY